MLTIKKDAVYKKFFVMFRLKIIILFVFQIK